MSDHGFRRVVRTGLAPLIEGAPEGPSWADLTSTPIIVDADRRVRYAPWLVGVGSAILVLTLVGVAALLGGNNPSPPIGSTTSTQPSVGFQPPTRTVDDETWLDLTLLDGSQISLAYPSDLDLTSQGVETSAVGGVGAPNRQIEVRYETPAEFIIKTEEFSGPGELTHTYEGPDGGTVERWEFSDIAYLVFDFDPWTATVWDTKTYVSANAEGWAKNLHGSIDSNDYLVLNADSPLAIVRAGDDPRVDGPDIRVEGDSGGLLVFIDDCDRMTLLDEEAYGQEVFAFCDESTNTLFFVSGAAEIQQTVHETLRVNPEAEPTTSTSVATPTTGDVESQGQWIRVVDPTDALGGTGDQVVSGVAVGENEFVAVGEDEKSADSSEDDQAAVWRSESGVEWLRVEADPSFVDAAMTDVVWFPNSAVYVAVGHHISEGAVWVSADSFSWERVAVLGFEGPAGGIEMEAITVGGPGVVAVGREWLSEGLSIPAVWMSPDGREWTRVGDLTRFSDNAGMVDVVQHGGTLYATGFVEQTMPAVWTYSDNSFWEIIASGPQIGRDVYLTSIASDGQRLAVAGGSDAEDVDSRVWTSSDDGQTWVARRQLPSDGGIPSLNDVAVSSSGWLAVGEDSSTFRPNVGAAVWTSPFGIDWNRYSPETPALSPEAGGVVMTTAVFGVEVAIAGGYTGLVCADRYARCELDAAFWVWLP